tara:strand:- start:10762 stop:11613 length:852 start_codon:yes stop_codon:yes gene_type:complete
MKMSKKPLVSVVIPTYNEETYIKESLRTMFKQNYSKIEIIVVDDGSDDGTIDIVKRFKNVILKKQDHKGPGLARNFGAEFAKGEILIFVDADMAFPSNYISKLIEPIISGRCWGTIHSEERVANEDNIWARCWGPVIPLDKDGKGLIFRAITKEKFLEYDMFDPAEGYADDQSIMKKSGVKAEPVDVFCYHHNPDSLSDVFVQSRWIGSSYRFWFLNVPVLNIAGAFFLYLLFYPLIIVNSLRCMFREKSVKYLFFYLPFGLVKYNGAFVGIVNRIFRGKRIK